jgi:hypothetical protein
MKQGKKVRGGYTEQVLRVKPKYTHSLNRTDPSILPDDALLMPLKPTAK